MNDILWWVMVGGAAWMVVAVVVAPVVGRVLRRGRREQTHPAVTPRCASTTPEDVR